MEQGTIPLTAATHYQSSGANSAMNFYLLNPNGWPWVPAQSYFLLITNTSASAQPFSFALNGRTFFNDDEDNDGLPDYWERQHFAGSLAYIGASDPDGDGVSNLNEFLNGTSPLTADPFSLSQPSHGSNGRFQFLFSGPNNGRYRAEFRTNLNIGAWSSMGLFTNAGGTRWIIDSNAPASSQRFYRAVVP